MSLSAITNNISNRIHPDGTTNVTTDQLVDYIADFVSENVTTFPCNDTARLDECLYDATYPRKDSFSLLRGWRLIFDVLDIFGNLM